MEHNILLGERPKMEKGPEVNILDMFAPIQPKIPKLQTKLVKASSQQAEHRYLRQQNHSSKATHKFQSRMTPQQIRYNRNMQNSKSQLQATKKSQINKKAISASKKGGIQIIDTQKIFQQKKRAKQQQKMEKRKKNSASHQLKDKSVKTHEQNHRDPKQIKAKNQRQKMQIERMQIERMQAKKQAFINKKRQQQKKLQKQLMCKQIQQQKRKLPQKNDLKNIQTRDKRLKQKNKDKKIEIIKKKKYRDEQEEENDSMIDEDQNQDPEKWRHLLQQITGYNPNAQKFKKRDRQSIQDARSGQILKEQKISAYLGKKEQQEDELMEYERKKKKVNRN